MVLKIHKGLGELRKKLSHYINCVLYKNEEIVITKHGRAIAKITSIEKMQLSMKKNLILKRNNKMFNLDDLIDESLDRGDSSFDDIDEDLKNKIIFAALQDNRFDQSDLILDGNFDLIKLLEHVNNCDITTEEMYISIMRGLESSLRIKINLLIKDRAVNIFNAHHY